MSQRRFHTKSRYGCSQCKNSRKKCDEVRPQCSRCKKIGQDCSLSDASSSLMFVSSTLTTERRGMGLHNNKGLSESTTSLTGSSSSGVDSLPEELSTALSLTSTSLIPSADPHFGDAERERLELMYHYMLYTAKTIAEISIPKDGDQNIWTNFAIELAFENDLVLHGLLSVSALHLALRGVSKRKNTILAIRHHDLGLSLFRPYLSNITGQNYDAIFAFNSIVMLYAFGIQRCSESTANAIVKIHQILTLIHNSKPITKSHMVVLKQSRWSSMMLKEPFPCLDDRLPDEVENMLANLMRRASLSAAAEKQAEVYIPVIQSLRYILMLTSIPRPPLVSFVVFPMMASGEYWDLVKTYDSLALAILANHAVTLHRIGDSIWLKGWGKETIDAISEILTPEWHDCVAWAVRETRTGTD